MHTSAIWFVIFLSYSSRKLTSTNATPEEKPFLEPGALQYYIAVAGRLSRLTRLPPQCDINEWLATNSELCVLFVHAILLL